jgi:hypothetical protein
MDNHLFGMIHHNAIPRMNEKVMRGLAVEQMRVVERHVDGLFRSISKSFPPGLRYEGCTRCTPQEEYNVVTPKRSGKPVFDIARNNLFLMKYRFTYNGEPMYEPHMYLPYMTQAGLITIRGSTFSISPVLADRAISYGVNTIFIPLQVTKLTFERLDHTFRIYDLDEGNLETSWNETANVAWATVYNRNPAQGTGNRNRITAKHTMAHYLFSKYGVSQAFKMMSNTDVFVGYPDEINYDIYPKEEWLICGSKQICPRSLRGVRRSGYIPTNIRLAIRRTAWTTQNIGLVAGFFYVTDHFPQRVEPEFIESTRFWRILLGHLIFGPGQSEGKLADEIDNHIESLDESLDERSRLDLLSENIHANDIYQLFAFIIGALSEMVIQSDNVESTMYDKELMVLRYALFDINKAISHFKFALQKAVRKPKVKEEINNALRRNLTVDAIMKINRQHGEVAGVSSPGDNLYFKITSNLVPQTSATGNGRNSGKSSAGDASKLLHSSIVEVGSYNNLPKASPSGRTRISPYVQYDDSYRVVRNEKFRALIDNVQRRIQFTKYA